MGIYYRSKKNEIQSNTMRSAEQFNKY